MLTGPRDNRRVKEFQSAGSWVPCPRLPWACWQTAERRDMPTASVGMAPAK